MVGRGRGYPVQLRTESGDLETVYCRPSSSSIRKFGRISSEEAPVVKEDGRLQVSVGDTVFIEPWDGHVSSLSVIEPPEPSVTGEWRSWMNTPTTRMVLKQRGREVRGRGLSSTDVGGIQRSFDVSGTVSGTNVDLTFDVHGHGGKVGQYWLERGITIHHRKKGHSTQQIRYYTDDYVLYPTKGQRGSLTRGLFLRSSFYDEIQAFSETLFGKDE